MAGQENLELQLILEDLVMKDKSGFFASLKILDEGEGGGGEGGRVTILHHVTAIKIKLTLVWLLLTAILFHFPDMGP